MVACMCFIIRATSFVKITNIMNRIRYVLVSLDFITCSKCSFIKRINYQLNIFTYITFSLELFETSVH